MDEDRYRLQRFVDAQNCVYNRVKSELAEGRKRSHWIWFIFPQIDGLGHSSTAIRYAIKSRAEAIAYLSHPVLGLRLIECVNLMLGHDGTSITAIMGYPDDLKFRSSMTLFAEVAEDPSPFDAALSAFFGGIGDNRTQKILDTMDSSKGR